MLKRFFAKKQSGPTISYQGKSYSFEKGQTVLDTLLAADLDIPHSCKAGLCQACTLQCVDGELPASAAKSLRSNQQAMGYFLACQCAPESSLEVAPLSSLQLRQPAKIVGIEPLSDSVTSLQLKSVGDDGMVDSRAGQYVTLWLSNGVGRSYSLASLPSDGVMEFHVKHIKGGKFSEWLRDTASLGDEIQVQGPMGLCFYDAKPEEPLLLSCIGTGLAPMLGILRDALSRGHQGAIHVVFGAKAPSGFYALSILEALQRQHANVSLHCVSQLDGECSSEDESVNIAVGDIYEYVTELLDKLEGAKVYTCGADSFVRKMRRSAFLSGVKMDDIFADAFLPSASN